MQIQSVSGTFVRRCEALNGTGYPLLQGARFDFSPDSPF
jgi:hypothetical protein